MTSLRTTEWLTVSEVAEALRISAPTAYRLIAAGQLPALRIGNQLRVDADELRAYLTAARVGDGSEVRG